MASSAPAVNRHGSAYDALSSSLGEAQGIPTQRGVNPEETAEQIKILIEDNRELKDAIQRTNSSMKEKFGELAAWTEKQKGERDFLEGKLEEAKKNIGTLTRQSQELQQRLQDSEGGGHVADQSRELRQARAALEAAKSANKTLIDRSRALELDAVALQQTRREKQLLQGETQQLALQLESVESLREAEQKRAEDLRRSLAQLQEAFTQLSEENQRMKEEVKKQENSQVEELQARLKMAEQALAAKQEKLDELKQEVFKMEKELENVSVFKAQNSLVEELQARLETAEQALAAKQEKLDELKQEVFKKEKELENVSVFEVQAEVYKADFFAERAAREQIHEEKEHLSEQMKGMQEQIHLLEEELLSRSNQSLMEMQRRHQLSQGPGPEGGAAAHAQPGARGMVKIPEHACPKCNVVQPDLDSLQIHIMDCID